MSSCTTAFKRSAKHYRYNKNQTNIIGIDLIEIEKWARKQNEMHAYVFVCDVVVCITIFYRNVLIYFIQQKGWIDEEKKSKIFKMG